MLLVIETRQLQASWERRYKRLASVCVSHSKYRNCLPVLDPAVVSHMQVSCASKLLCSEMGYMGLLRLPELKFFLP